MAAYSTYTDQELMDLLKVDPDAAVVEIYNRYWSLLLDTAYRRLKSREESEEVVQEIFISLYLRRNELHITSTLEGFLKNALKNKVLNFFRHQMRKERYVQLVESIPVGQSNEIEEQLHNRDLARQIKEATQRLPEKCREVFILSKIEHQSNSNIAEKLGISVSTVEKHISRGMKLMRENLEGYDHELLSVVMILSLHALHIK